MNPAAPDVSMQAAGASHSDSSEPRAHKARRLAHPANSKTPQEWVNALCDSRANFLATTAVPDDPLEALRGGLILTPCWDAKLEPRWTGHTPGRC